MAGLLRRPLTDEERAQLRAWQDSRRTSLYIRARIVFLAERTANAAAIARALGVHVQTVRKTLRRFHAAGLAGIALKPRLGRARVFGDKAADILIEILHRSPAEYGGDDGRWTLEQAAQALARELGVESVSTETVRLLLKRRHLSWQRAKEWIRSPDPQYARKKSGVSAFLAG